MIPTQWPTSPSEADTLPRTGKDTQWYYLGSIHTEDGIGTNQNYFLSIVLFFFQTPTLSKTNFEPHLGPACPKLTHPLCRCCNRLFGVGGRERFSGRLFCVGIEFLSATTFAKGKVKRWFPPTADCPGNCLVCKSNDPQHLIKRPPGLFALGW